MVLALTLKMRRPQGTAPVPNATILKLHREHGWHERTIRRVIDGQPLRTYIARKVKAALSVELGRRRNKTGAN